MTPTLERAKHRIQTLLNQDNQSDKRNDEYFEEYLTYIKSHLVDFITKYADENGLSVSQASKSVTTWDREQFASALDGMDTSDWPEEATDRLGFYISRYKDIDKRHMLLAILGIGAIRWAVKAQKQIDITAQADGQEQIEHQKKLFKLTAKPKQQRKKFPAKKTYSFITDPQNTASWSSRLWVDSDSMANDVENLVNKNIKHGLGPDDLTELMKKHIKKSQFKPTASIADRAKQMDYIVKRLVRSESAKMIDRVNDATYRQMGIEKVDWVTEPSACDICVGLAGGGPYTLDKAPKVVEDSHPSCRCIKIPHEEIEEVE